MRHWSFVGSGTDHLSHSHNQLNKNMLIYWLFVFCCSLSSKIDCYHSILDEIILHKMTTSSKHVEKLYHKGAVAHGQIFLLNFLFFLFQHVHLHVYRLLYDLCASLLDIPLNSDEV